MSLTYKKGGVHIKEDGKVYRKGIVQFPNGDYYEGELLDRKRCGKGVFLYANGDKYVGEFLDDLRHGFGVFTQVDEYVKGQWLRGRRYEGYWKKGNMHGRGLWVIGNGTSYEGEFKDGKFDGNGFCSYSNGDRYAGEWKSGFRHGRGKLELVCNDVYEGEFKSGKKDGHGTYIYARDGGYYSGEFKRDKMHGSGLRVYASGSRYDGQFLNGKRHGQGVYSSFNGDTYVGKFLDNKYHDEGVITFSHGDRYEGRFLNGMFYGFGKYIYADGGYYEGEYLAVFDHYRSGVKFPNTNGERNGYGIRVWANGNRYEGEWKDNKMNGRGKMEFADGSEYVGDFRDGEPHGEGTKWYGAGNGAPYECPMRLRSCRGRIMSGFGRCRYTGTWHKGQWHKQGHFWSSDGTEYVGEFKHGVRHGQGKQILIRDVERGKTAINEQKLTGMERLRLAVGGVDTLYRACTYEGGFEEGSWKGVGTLTFCDGSTLTAKFKALPLGNGIPIGVATFTFYRGKMKRLRRAEFSQLGEFVKWLDENDIRPPSQGKGVETNLENTDHRVEA